MSDNGFVDLIFTNADSSNQILYNNRHSGATPLYSSVSLPTNKVKNNGANSVVIKAADVDNGKITCRLFYGQASYTNLFLKLLTADGNPEIVVGKYLGQDEIIYNRGEGKLNDPIDLPVSNSSTTNDMLFFDANNDGWIDLIVAKFLGPNYLLYNDGTGPVSLMEKNCPVAVVSKLLLQ